MRRPVALPLSMPVATEPTPQTNQAEAKPVPVVQPRGIKVADTSGALRQRDVAARGDAAEIERLGGSAAAQRAIKGGLAWLARQQTSDGHWELHQGYPDAGTPVIKTDTGATALALLALLGGEHGQQAGLRAHRRFRFLCRVELGHIGQRDAAAQTHLRSLGAHAR
ncbi:MAG: hypothetical protein B7Z55_19850 [Planctomycetales bacterium 12-60-4]|nr:MAG: hypothetical protein B7Z55_19850 [Planctomycetales bacterium 12-60-4]